MGRVGQFVDQVGQFVDQVGQSTKIGPLRYASVYGVLSNSLDGPQTSEYILSPIFLARSLDSFGSGTWAILA